MSTAHTMTTRTRRSPRAILACLTAVIGLVGLQAGQTQADTFYGPTGTPGAGTFPTTVGATGNPTVIHLLRNGNPSGQAIEVAENSSTPGAVARTWDTNGTNAQRVYFQLMRMQWALYTEVDDNGALHNRMERIPLYRIVHYTSAGSLCLDADASAGMPTIGSRLQWVWCHELWDTNPQQLWLFATTPRAGLPGVHAGLFNLAASVEYPSDKTSTQLADLLHAPIVTASANMIGQRTQLTLSSRGLALPTNSLWGVEDVGPEPGRPGQEQCTGMECLVAGGNPTPGCYFICVVTD